MNKTEFKAEVKKQLTLKDWSYKELAEHTGYKQQSIQVMMCDDKKLTPQAMSKFAKILGIDGVEQVKNKDERFPRFVYAIMHRETKKIYIGSSKNPQNRCISHIRSLRNGKHIVEDMQSDFNKYGEKFSFFILDEIKNQTEEDKEYKWMDKYKSFNRAYGYNYKDSGFARWKENIVINFEDELPPMPEANERG